MASRMQDELVQERSLASSEEERDRILAVNLQEHPNLLHLTPHTLHPTPYILHPKPYAPNPQPCLQEHPHPQTQNSKPQT